jgi:hypothetical protein
MKIRIHFLEKVIFIALAIILIGGMIFLLVEYPLITKNEAPAQNPSALEPPGTCKPDLTSCQGNAELCMKDNLNKVCS